MTGWQISERVAYVVSAPDRVVALNLDRPAEPPLAFLGTGAAIWQALVDPVDGLARPVVDEQRLIDDLAAAYAAPREAITADVTAFLAQQAATGMLVRHVSASEPACRNQ
jgi:hypothetical protein